MPDNPPGPKRDFDAFAASIDPITLLNTIVTVVTLIETLFKKRRKAGPAKKQKAMKAILRLIGHDVDIPRPVMLALGALVDVAAEQNNEWAAVTTIRELYQLVLTTFATAQGFFGNDAAARAFVLGFVNGEVDIPGIDEATEEFVIGFLLDLVIASAAKRNAGIVDI